MNVAMEDITALRMQTVPTLLVASNVYAKLGILEMESAAWVYIHLQSVHVCKILIKNLSRCE